MIRTNNFGEETFECSRCANEVNEFDDNCGVCGHVFNNKIDYSNKENKHRAISYTIGEFNGREVFITTLNNSKRGILKFIVKTDSQIAMRVKYFIHNNNSDFLENGLMQDSLIKYEEFIVMELQNEKYYINEKLFDNEENDDDFESKGTFLNNIKQEQIENIFVYGDDWIDLECSLEYKNALKECISYIRPEMFFSYLYRLIILYDFEKKSKEIPNNKELLSLFEEASKKILKESCYFLIDKYENPDEELILSFSWENYHINYSKQVDALKDSTLHFINYSKRIQEAIEVDENENPYTSQASLIFFQYIMFMGVRMAHTRIINELNNKSFLGCEIIKSYDYSELIIYLTPEGMRNLTKILKMTVEERLEIFNSFLNKNKIKKIDSETLKKTFNTSILLEYENNIYKHYLQYSDYLNDFMSERINRKHLSSIWAESQANYKQVKI